MSTTVYTVMECGQEQGSFFARPIGVYSSMDKAQEAMDKCFMHTYRILEGAADVRIDSYEMCPMETTILFAKNGYGNKHMVVIDEHTIDVSNENYIY